jgi:ABC-type transport system involved in multi-copper enzyme maturation permease subunit
MFLTDQGANSLGGKSFDVVLIFINLWSTFISAYLASGCVRSDIDSKVIAQLLSFPFKRWQYLAARILGITLIVFFYYLLTYIVALVLFSASSGALVGGLNLIGALVVHFFKILTVCTWAILISLSLSRLMSFVSTICLMFLVALSNSGVRNISWSSMVTEFDFFALLGLIMDTILPRSGYLADISNKILLSEKLPENFMFDGPIHFLLTFPLLCGLIYLIFRKKEI